MDAIMREANALIGQMDTVAKRKGESSKFDRLNRALVEKIEQIFEQFRPDCVEYFSSLAGNIEKHYDLSNTLRGTEIVNWLHNAASIFPSILWLRENGFFQNCNSVSYPPIKLFCRYYTNSLPEFEVREYQDGAYRTLSKTVQMPSLYKSRALVGDDGDSGLSDLVRNYLESDFENKQELSLTSLSLEASSPIRIQKGRWETEVIVEFLSPIDESRQFIYLPNQKKTIKEFEESLIKFRQSAPLQEYSKDGLQHVFRVEDSSSEQFKGIYVLWRKNFQEVVFKSNLAKLSITVHPQQFEVASQAMRVMVEASLQDAEVSSKKRAEQREVLRIKTEHLSLFYKQIQHAFEKDFPIDEGPKRIQKRVKEDSSSSSIWLYKGKKYLVLSRKDFNYLSEGCFKHIHLAFRIDDLSTVLFGERYVWMTMNFSKATTLHPELNIFNEIIRQKLTDSYLLQPIFVESRISRRLTNKLGFMTEYCNGGIFSLKNLEQQKIKLKDRIELFLQVIKAVRALHKELNYYHCDIKEDNILLKRVGRKFEVRLADFGLSQRIGSEYKVQGAPLYQPPEIYFAPINKSAPYTPSVDVFSLGHIVLNVLLEHPSPLVTASKDKFFEIMLYSSNLSGLPNDCKGSKLCDLAKSMLDRVPGKRPNLPKLEKAFQTIYDDNVEIATTEIMISNSR